MVYSSSLPWWVFGLFPVFAVMIFSHRYLESHGQECLLGACVCVWVAEILWAVACQAPISMEVSGKNTGVGAMPFSRDLPDPGIKPGSSELQADSLPYELQAKHIPSLYALKSILRSKILKHRAYEHSNLKKHRQCQFS